MVSSQMANPENGTWLIRDAGSIDALIMGSRSASYSGRLTGLLASLRRAYLGTRAFVTSLRTLISNRRLAEEFDVVVLGAGAP
jgi:hypothetical protein